ncbi:MAG TPA: ArsR family transcriptional regulator [Flavobacteriaceae bacterium]|nr:ArsR family transcriptional regulator [Flavobacteriaceae bacterium]
MGASKTFVFAQRQNQIAIVMKALGHLARVAILDYLAKMGQAVSKDIVNELPLSQPTVVQHLQELKKSGLIRGVFNGSKTLLFH